jgi:hypothetical protein
MNRIVRHCQAHSEFSKCCPIELFRFEICTYFEITPIFEISDLFRNKSLISKNKSYFEISLISLRHDRFLSTKRHIFRISWPKSFMWVSARSAINFQFLLHLFGICRCPLTGVHKIAILHDVWLVGVANSVWTCVLELACLRLLVSALQDRG